MPQNNSHMTDLTLHKHKSETEQTTQQNSTKIQSTVAREERDSEINSRSIFRLVAVDGVGDGEDQQGRVEDNLHQD